MSACGDGEAANCGHAYNAPLLVSGNEQVRILLGKHLVYDFPVGTAR